MFDKLPNDLKAHIASKLNAKDLVSATKTSKASNRLFTPLLPFAQFLLHVAHGNQEQAEAMLQKAQQEDKANNTENTSASTLLKLLQRKGTVTDLSDRTFEDITAFQFTLWALDRHMWVMLLKYLRPEDALAQYQEHQQTGVSYELMGKKIIGEKHHDLLKLKEAYEQYLSYMNTAHSNTFNWPEAHKRSAEIGEAQRYAPTHVAQEYLRADRSFNPTPTFKEDHLPQSFESRDQGNNTNKFLRWFRKSQLGSPFLMSRGSFSRPWRIIAASSMDSDRCVVGLQLDAVAMRKLHEVRTQEHGELITILNAKLHQVPKADEELASLSQRPSL